MTVVSHVAGSGVYCLKLNSGTASNVVAMIDNTGADPRFTFVSGDVNASVSATACPSGGFEMATGTIEDSFTDEPFFVQIN